MFGKGGKDLDLTTPRAKTWQPTSTSAPPRNHPPQSIPGVKSTVDGPRRPAAQMTTVASQPSIEAAEGQVLARYSTMGVLQVLMGFAVSAFLAWVVGNWIIRGAFAAWMGLGFVMFFLFAGFTSSTLVGVFNLLRRGGRAVWIEGDRLRMVDPMGDNLKVALAEIKSVRFEPRFKRGKNQVKAIVVTLANGKQRALSISVIDRPHDEIVDRIREARGVQPEA